MMFPRPPMPPDPGYKESQAARERRRVQENVDKWFMAFFMAISLIVTVVGSAGLLVGIFHTFGSAGLLGLGMGLYILFEVTAQIRKKL